MAGKEIPTGVKVISILYYLGAVFSAIVGILLIVGAGMADSFVSEVPVIAEIGAGMFVVVGIIMIGLGVLSFFIGKGLWKGRSWARTLVIILCCMGVVTALISIAGGDVANNVFNILLNGVVGGYLWFNKRVKKAFS
jgi:hypothetical protein